MNLGNCQDKLNVRNKKIHQIRSKIKQNTLLIQKKSIMGKYLQNGNLEQNTFASNSQLDPLDCSFFEEKPSNIPTNMKSPLKMFDRNYIILQKIGEGAHGVVKKCKSLKNGKIYAVKLLKMDDEQIAYLKKNFINIESLNHPSIIKYKGMYFQEKKSLCYLIMECFPFPNLLEIEIESQKELKEITKKVIQTLVYLHKNKICHRDIKPDNILYDKISGNIKVIDFGISKFTFERSYKVEMFTNTGTLYYKAPQMFLGGGYDNKVDMWALGVTIFRLVQKKTPFESTYHNETIKKIINGELSFKDQIWQKYDFAKDLVLRLLKPFAKRLNAEQARNHIWFDSISVRQIDTRNSMLLFENQIVKLNSIEEFLKNKSQNMKSQKNGDIKKDLKMEDWLKEQFQGVDFTESLEFY